jgi:membrane fusion protein, multidrug efflux system
MKSSKVKVLFIVVLLIIALVIAGALTYSNRAPASDEGLVQKITTTSRPVKTVVIHPQTLVEKLSATGLLEAERDVVLNAEVGGKVDKVFKQMGDNCKKGDPLIKLDAEGYQIALAQARASLAQAEVGFDSAVRDFGRMEKLRADAVVSAQQLDGADSAKQVGAAGVAQARAALKFAQRNVRETSIRCPFNGTVAKMGVDLGQMIGPQVPLARVVDQSRLKLSLAVTSGQLARLSLGDPVTLGDSTLPGQSFTGSVSRLGIAADERTRTFPVEITVNEKENTLHAGQVVQATVELKKHEDALAVPLDAIVNEHEGPTVRLVVGNTSKLCNITIGPRIDDKVVILNGLKEGDEVIVVGGSGLKDGTTVEVIGGSSTSKQQTPDSPAKAESE